MLPTRKSIAYWGQTAKKIYFLMAAWCNIAISASTCDTENCTKFCSVWRKMNHHATKLVHCPGIMWCSVSSKAQGHKHIICGGSASLIPLQYSTGRLRVRHSNIVYSTAVSHTCGERSLMTKREKEETKYLRKKSFFARFLAHKTAKEKKNQFKQNVTHAQICK